MHRSPGAPRIYGKVPSADDQVKVYCRASAGESLAPRTARAVSDSQIDME